MRKQGKNVGLLTVSVLMAALLTAGCGNSAVADNEVSVDNTAIEAELSQKDIAAETNTQDSSAESKTDETTTAEAAAETKTEDAKTEEQNTEEAKTEEVTGESSLFSEVSSEGFSTEGALKGKKSSLPAYEYPGPEQFYSELYEYIIENMGKYYLQ